jgi:histidinol-phosphate/aromatic aminotransferase/cobyric acid decarboxylase-like protein
VPVAAGGTFVVADVGDARAFAERMLARGVRVRDCKSFGLPRLVRVGVRGDAEQARLVEAWSRA